MKLAGFLVLLAVIFVGARAVGARLGPVDTGHTHIQYSQGTGNGRGMGGMRMGLDQ